MHDWLGILITRYNDALRSDPRTPESHIDIDFSQCPHLQMIPQFVFGLLRSPLLRLHEEGIHPDYRIYLQCLFRYVIFSFCNAVHKAWCLYVSENVQKLVSAAVTDVATKFNTLLLLE